MRSYGRVLPNAWRIILPIWGVTLFVLIFSNEVVLNLFLLALSAGVAALFYIPKRLPFEKSENLLIAPVDGVVEAVETDEDGTKRLVLKRGFLIVVLYGHRSLVLLKRVMHAMVSFSHYVIKRVAILMNM